jgi:hypothetical protein
MKIGVKSEHCVVAQCDTAWVVMHPLCGELRACSQAHRPKNVKQFESNLLDALAMHT